MYSNTPYLPKANFQKFVIQELPEELLVYDLEINKAFSLNRTSALVWQNCDGTKSVDEIAGAIEKAGDGHVPAELVWLTLAKLEHEHLIEPDDRMMKVVGVNRRQMITKVGLSTAMAFPVVLSVLAPKAVNAQSGEAAAVCFTCNKKINGIGSCPQFCVENEFQGNCYDNSGCGNGQLLATNVLCVDCFSGIYSPQPFNGTVSWKA